MKQAVANSYYRLIKAGRRTLDDITDPEVRALVEAMLG